MKHKNIFLTLSLLALAAEFFHPGESVSWYICPPAAAVFFVLFLIFTVLEKETALFDEQQRVARQSDSTITPPVSSAKSQRELVYNPHKDNRIAA